MQEDTVPSAQTVLRTPSRPRAQRDYTTGNLHVNI